MTVMVNRYFAIPKAVIQNGTWARMKPGEKDLYLFICYLSESRSCKQVVVTDAEIEKFTGTSPRTLSNARKKAVEHRLVKCERISGNKYRYTICDPETGEPFPGDPKVPSRYVKQAERTGESYQLHQQIPSSQVKEEPKGFPMKWD